MWLEILVEYCQTVGAYWLVTGEDGSMVVREWISICSGTLKVKRV